MEKQFLHSQLLGNRTVGITGELHIIHFPLQAHGLDIRFQDRFVAYHPYHLVDNTVLGYFFSRLYCIFFLFMLIACASAFTDSRIHAGNDQQRCQEAQTDFPSWFHIYQ